MITQFCPDTKKRNSCGFTLLELSIVLLIMSLILGTTLGFLSEKTDADKIKETERRLDKIEEAISQFVIQNKYIPCPARSDSAPNIAAFGVADVLTATTCTTYVASPFIGDPAETETGIVPTKTLQIPDEYAYDAWGRRISYVMAESCKDATQFILASGSCSGKFTIRDASGANKATDGIIVLMSHGKNGHGAFPHHGNTTRVFAGATVSADEALNGRLSGLNVFQANNGVFVQKSRTNSFDDIVRYKSRAQIIKETGGMTGMSGSLIATSDTDPLCRMLDSKLGLSFPSVIPNPNRPLLPTAQSICGLTTVAEQTASSCDDYMFELATQAYAFCF